jgi:hypothetical protein
MGFERFTRQVVSGDDKNAIAIIVRYADHFQKPARDSATDHNAGVSIARQIFQRPAQHLCNFLLSNAVRLNVEQSRVWVLMISNFHA